MKPTKNKHNFVLLEKKHKKMKEHGGKVKKLKNKINKHVAKKMKTAKKVIIKNNIMINGTCTREISTITLPSDEKPMKCPLGKMLRKCNFAKSKFPTSLDHLPTTQAGNTFIVKSINYQMPQPVELVDDFSSDCDSDLGSPVDSEPTPVDSEPEVEQFIKEKVGDYLLYEIPQGAVLVLHGNSKVFLHGFMQINILHGGVEIMGKTLDKLSPPAMVYSPRGSAYISIQNLNNSDEIDEDNVKKSLKTQLLLSGLDRSICREVITYKLKTNTVIIHCRNVIDKATEFLEENLAQKIYPKLQNGLRCVFRNVTSPDWNVLEVNADWSELVKTISNDKLLLCGGKGVGKSTLLRFLANKLLNAQEEVFILDLDPGQPEFTVPGAISLIRVTAPLLGPNYTHLQSTETSIFVPNINISADHDCFLDCVRKLIQSLPQDVTVLINFMGFTKGIGLFLTASVMSLLQPSVVVQIVSQNDSRNFNVDLTPETLRQQVLLDDNDSDAMAAGSIGIGTYKLMKIDSMARKCNGGWELEPRQVREMCILAYLSRILPAHCKYLTERDVKIYHTSLNDISIIYNGKPCDVHAVNANIVALCLEDGQTCLGWGLVRGYCKKTNRLLLVTPVDEDELERIKSLVIGSVSLPPAIYLRHHDAIRGIVPFTYKGELSNFAKSPKRSILPKQLNKNVK